MKRYIMAGAAIVLFLVMFACRRTTTAGTDLPADPDPQGKLFKIGILPYGANYLKPPLKSSVIAWIAGNFDWSIGGPDMGKGNQGAISVGYETILGGYSNELPRIKDFAQERGLNFENMLVHMKGDYTAVKPWQGMDKFDFFEGKNGVVSKSSAGYRDLTAAAYGDKPAYVPFGSILYLGYEEPFDRVNIRLDKPGSADSTGWQYWNGATWRSLPAMDGTDRCRQSGQLRFPPPSDWKRWSLNDSRQKWWIRFVADGALSPVASRIRGDDWLVGEGKGVRCRGWDSTAPGIINRGTPLEYNPTPPPTAGARFRYQARATGYWSPGYFYFNPADFQKGVRTAALFVAEKTSERLQGSTVRAIMFDSANNGLETGIAPPAKGEAPSLSDFDDAKPLAWGETARERYADVIKLVKQKHPGILLGANVYPRGSEFIRTGDFALYEYHSFARQGSSPRLIATTDDAKGTISSYDSFRRENNPKGTTGIFIYADLVDYDDKKNLIWDRAQRGPLAALTKHYIAMNENTVFVYYSEGAFRYSSSDELFCAKESTELTVKQDRDFSSQTKYIRGKDFSRLTSVPEFGMVVRIGKDLLRVKKVDNQTLSTINGFRFDHAVGESVGMIGVIHQSQEPLPPMDRVYRWSYLFPAMKVDIGIPDRNGHNRGRHDLGWKKRKDVGGGPEIWRRDFTKAVVLHRTAGYDTPGEEYNSYCPPIPLNGVYYPLGVDGVTGEPVRSIALRAGEGVILMKKPVLPSSH